MLGQCMCLLLFPLLTFAPTLLAQQGSSNNAQGMSIGTLLDTLSEKGRQDLQLILNKQDNLTKKQMNDALDDWAKQQGDSFNMVYQALETAYQEARTELDARHVQQMANQTAEVREADQQIRAISNNQFISLAEEKNQIAALMAKLPEAIVQQLQKLAPYPVAMASQ